MAPPLGTISLGSTVVGNITICLHHLPGHVIGLKDPSRLNIVRFIISIHESEKVLVLNRYLILVPTLADSGFF